MKLGSEKLAAELERQLLPVYVISGDEPLLAAEAADAVRQRARAAGFTEREVFFIERSASAWHDALQATETLSLFASRRVIDLRIGPGKQDKDAPEYLARLVAAAGDDLLLLVSMPKLDGRASTPAWLQAAEKRGAWVTVWPLRPHEFPGWLQARFRAAGLQVRDDALHLLLERSEGNLLAAGQEVQKLALLFGPGALIDAKAVAASSMDSARFNVFQLSEAVIARQSARALRIVAGLRAEGEEPTLILWALQRARGELPLPANDARARATATRLALRALRADKMLKGRQLGDVWDEIDLLTAELCGVRPLPLQRWQLRAT